jgi:hypothetical protein
MVATPLTAATVVVPLKVPLHSAAPRSSLGPSSHRCQSLGEFSSVEVPP